VVFFDIVLSPLPNSLPFIGFDVEKLDDVGRGDVEGEDTLRTFSFDSIGDGDIGGGGGAEGANAAVGGGGGACIVGVVLEGGGGGATGILGALAPGIDGAWVGTGAGVGGITGAVIDGSAGAIGAAPDGGAGGAGAWFMEGSALSGC